jgi:hypothetical protein
MMAPLTASLMSLGPSLKKFSRKQMKGVNTPEFLLIYATG